MRKPPDIQRLITFCFRLSARERAQLEAAARRDDRPAGAFVRQAVTVAIKQSRTRTASA
jgi:hypothetical protein